MPNLFRLLKPYPAAPLPEFPRMDPKELPGASCLLYYGGTKLTEMAGNRLYRHQFTPPAFHASLYLGGGEHLNVGMFREIEPVEKQFKSTRRLDAIVYDITPAQRLAIIAAGRKDTTKPKVGIMIPDYGWQEFLRAALPWFKPTDKDICSENFVENMAQGAARVTYYAAHATYPWHLLEYALEHQTACAVVTLHVGEDFNP